MKSYVMCEVLALWMTAIYSETLFATEPGIVQDICIMENFEGHCKDDRVILMGSAYFGRKQQTGRCVPTGSENPGCVADVTNYFDEHCSGRPTCSVEAADEQLFELYTCHQDFIPYLEVSYDCIPVLYDRQHLHACHSDGVVVISGLTEGIIASYSVLHSRTGSGFCPWIIEVSSGQRINITLMDFGMMQTSQGGCRKYVEIIEETAEKSTSVCSGTQRERTVYVSTSHRVELQFEDYHMAALQSHFLLEYRAVGCQDPVLRGNILLERSAVEAVLQCGNAGRKRSLHCVGGEWNMEADNCQPGRDNSSIKGNLIQDHTECSSLVIIVFVITLVVICCLCLIVCSVYCLCLRRLRTHNPPSQSVYYEPRDLHPKIQTDYDWNSGPSFEKQGSQTYERRKLESKQYTHVWKPVNTDVMILETPDVPKRISSLNDPVIKDPTLPKKTEIHQHGIESTYETPTCRC